MADIKNEGKTKENQETTESAKELSEKTTSSSSTQPLEWGNKKHEEEKSDVHQSMSVGETGTGEESASKRQIVAFVAGLIIGALLTSIFV